LPATQFDDLLHQRADTGIALAQPIGELPQTAEQRGQESLRSRRDFGRGHAQLA
jgi:hypothetical protein